MSKVIMQINYSTVQKEETGGMLSPEVKSIIEKCLRIVHNIFLLFVRVVLSLIYGKGERVAPINNDILLESVSSLAEKIRTRKLKSVDVVKAFIARIEEINPMLNCVVEDRFKDALGDAQKADSVIDSKMFKEEQLAKDKPLLGVPFTTKDSIQVKNMINSAGLWQRKDFRADDDAQTIKLLREAGAIPLAITNVPELCMWWESNNKIYGRTKNPYDTNRTVGGSSGGEGCIQAAAGSAFGLGSDIGGSIRMPAFFNGIFGHKPSKFTVSNEGQFPPISGDELKSFLGVGPMCRYANDLKLILKVLTADKAEQLKLDVPVNMKNVKVFYQMDDGGAFLVQPVEKSITDILKKVVKHFESNYDEVPICVQFEKFRESTDIWCANMKDTSNPAADFQLGNFERRINPYIEYGKSLFGQSKHTFIALMNAIIERHQVQNGTEAYKGYVEKRNVLLKEIQELLGDNGVLLYPTHPTVAPYHWEPIARTFNFSYTAIFNCMGLPCTAVPLGLSKEGLPLGIQVVANHNQDRLCLAVAEELEKAFGGWVPPTEK